MTRLRMMHGWGFPAAVFAPLIDALSNDFSIAAPDSPGYTSVSAEQTWEDKDTENDALTVLLGWSLGGQQALQCALEQPHQFDRLVLFATTPCFIAHSGWPAGMDAAIFAGFRQLVESNPVAGMQQFVRLNAGGRPQRHVAAQLNSLSAAASLPALMHGLEQLATTDLRARLSQLQVPVQVMHASDDRVVPVAAGQWLAEYLPQAELVIYDSGGHAFFLQHTADVARRIRTYS